MGISMEWKIHVMTSCDVRGMFNITEKSFCSKICSDTSFFFDIPNYMEHLFFKLNIKFSGIKKARSCKISYHTDNENNIKSIVMNKNLQNDIVFVDIFDKVREFEKERKLYFKIEFQDKYKNAIQKLNSKLHVICELNKIS